MLSVCFVHLHIWLQAQYLYLSVENNEKNKIICIVQKQMHFSVLLGLIINTDFLKMNPETPNYVHLKKNHAKEKSEKYCNVKTQMFALGTLNSNVEAPKFRCPLLV